MISEEMYESSKKSYIFKNMEFQPKFRLINNSGKKKNWKSLKQIIAQERILSWSTVTVHYSLVSTPFNFKPLKKYSDISGLPANYTDPHTKLRYATTNEFIIVRNLPMDITAGYLALRGASNIVG